MSKARVKETGPAIKTREAMEGLCGDIARLTIERDALKTQLDESVAEVRDRYLKRFAELDVKLHEGMALARDWCEANPSAFDGKRSLDLAHAVVGFRTGQPKLQLLSGWTWARVLDVLRPGYVRTKREADKEKLIADRDALGPDALRAVGLRVVQDESFFVDPKRETRDEAEAAK